MRKFLFGSFLLFLFISFYLFNINKDIEKQFYQLNNSFKSYYIGELTNIVNFFDRYSSQASNIESLQKEVLISKMNEVPLIKLQTELENISNFNANTFEHDNTFSARVLYLRNIHDNTQVWLNYEKDNDHIDGLIYHDMVAGIVKSLHSKPLGLLNQNPKCNYGVFVGSQKAIGISHGIEDSENIIIRFIPLWANINLDDEVITNGLDNIFFEGLKVGRVIEIIDQINHKEVIVKPYLPSSVKKYYQVYVNEKIKEEIKN
jgi:rod shape-determining protein MreC